MTLLRALHAETLKMKRTIALKIVVLFPAVIVVLEFFAVSQAPFSSVNRMGISHEWTALTLGVLRPWGLLMMPLFLALETALIAGLDHSGNQWKSLFTRPLPRWTTYMAKLVLVIAIAGASTVVLLCGILADGVILPHIQSEVVFGFPLPLAVMFQHCAQVFGLLFPALAIQHWLSLRWQSFSVAIGVGIVATVLGVAIASAADQLGVWALYFPWALPALVVGRKSHGVAVALLVGGMFGMAATAAGCWDFCRREVT